MFYKPYHKSYIINLNSIFHYFGNWSSKTIICIHRTYTARQVAITEKRTYEKGKAFYQLSFMAVRPNFLFYVETTYFNTSLIRTNSTVLQSNNILLSDTRSIFAAVVEIRLCNIGSIINGENKSLNDLSVEKYY